MAEILAILAAVKSGRVIIEDAAALFHTAIARQTPPSESEVSKLIGSREGDIEAGDSRLTGGENANP